MAFNFPKILQVPRCQSGLVGCFQGVVGTGVKVLVRDRFEHMQSFLFGIKKASSATNKTCCKFDVWSYVPGTLGVKKGIQGQNISEVAVSLFSTVVNRT